MAPSCWQSVVALRSPGGLGAELLEGDEGDGVESVSVVFGTGWQPAFRLWQLVSGRANGSGKTLVRAPHTYKCSRARDFCSTSEPATAAAVMAVIRVKAITRPKKVAVRIFRKFLPDDRRGVEGSSRFLFVKAVSL